MASYASEAGTLGTASPFTGVARGLEAVSKGAALASVVLLLMLRVSLPPSVPWSLGLLVLAALAAGWMVGRASADGGQTLLAFLAPVLPAILAAATDSTDPFIYWAWLAGLVGCLLPSIRWSEWELPASWRVLLGGWALALSLAWPVLVGREVGFDLQRFADVSNATSWAGMSAPLVTGWMMHVVLLQLVGLLWLEWILRRASAAPEGKLPLAVHGLWIGATVSSVVAVYQGTVDLTFLSSVEWAARGRATGLMLDANSFGTVAALAGPLAVVAVRSRPWRHGAAAAAAVFAVNWAGVWMSGSRTAFLLALIGTGALAVTLLRLGRPRARVLVPVAGAFLAVVVVALTFSSVTDPLVRYGSLENPNDATVADSLLNRGGYGGIAVELFRERPLTGVGAGTYHWLAVDYLRMQLDQELSFDNARRCCTNPHWPARCQPTGFSPADAV